MAISITRLSGGLTPANGSDPRTFPTIWNNTATALEGIELDDLAGVVITSPANAQILFYDGTNWVNGAPLLIETAEQTGDYTLALADAGKVVNMNKTGTGTVTIPLNSSVPFPIGTVINVYNRSSSALTIAGAVGVTLRNGGAMAQYAEVSLRKRATDEWVLAGVVS